MRRGWRRISWVISAAIFAAVVAVPVAGQAEACNAHAEFRGDRSGNAAQGYVYYTYKISNCDIRTP